MIGKYHSYNGNRISPSQFLMLVVLRKGPMYGYEVLKRLREEFSGLWEPQTGALYPALKKLEEHGLLRSEQREGKDYYSLSPEGGRWLEERLASISNEVLFMSRYFQFIGEAAKEIGSGKASASETGALPPHMMHLMAEEMGPKDRLVHLRKVREMLGNGAAEIEKEIERLERAIEEG
ncbi:MAG: PadR family transcriptional regulator [Methanomassiliicoccales archaeon]|nr:PadR family transcriptional regulator [Methanomassiliicoccales archaeon]